MSLVEWVFANRRVSLTFVVLLGLVGVQGYLNLPKAENPDFTIRTATVVTRLPGANAQRMEELVSAVLEQKIVEMPELDNVTSTSRNGMSIVVAAFQESYTDMRPIFDDLRRKIEVAARELPQGVIGPEVDDEFDVFGTVYTLTGEGFDFPELEAVVEAIRDRLLTIDAVAKVEFQGVRDETIYVEYEDARLRELGFTANELANAIRNTNIISAGGRMLIGDERISLEPTGDFSGVEALRTAVLRNSAGELFQIQDLTRVERVLADPPTELVYAAGEPAVTINISMREGGDILVLGEQLDALMGEIEQRLPLGMTLRKTAFQADFVEQTVSDFVVSILQAVAIVGVVLLIFLGPRTGLIIAASIPITIAITLAVMNWFGMIIDQVSLSGLIIALGLLVDNSLVIAESIQLRLQRGVGRLAAAVAVAGEMRTPLMIGSATTIAAFSPVALAESAIGEFCASIFYIVAIALSVSWLLSMTVVPLLGGLMLPVGQREQAPGPLLRGYRALVGTAVRLRWLTVAIAAGLFYSMTLAMGMVENEFIPPSEEPLFTVELDMPQGVDIAVPQRIALEMNEWFGGEAAGAAGIVNWTQFVGSSAPAFKLGYAPGQSDAAHMTALVNVVDGAALDGAIAATATTIAARYPDAQYKVDRLSQGPPVSYPVQIRLSGPEIATLERLAAELAAKLRTIDGVMDTVNDWGVRSRKIRVDIDPDRANAAGVSNSDVASSLSAGISGNTVSELREGEERIPVVLRSASSDRTDLRRLGDLSINAAAGGSVPLGQVATVALDWEVPVIKRRDRLRTLTLSATALPGSSATDINRELQPWLAQWALPPGYRFEEGGESESSGEATQSIVDKLPIAGLVIVMLLLGQFNSFRRVGIVLLTIPLGLIGMAWGLVITGVAFGFFTILGIISLAGIVINNAIILLDRTAIEEAAGRGRREAVIEAATQRLRPILLTTATTCGGMTPLWLGGGMFETMAVTLIFGMLAGTCITLLVVPALYIILFPAERPAALERAEPAPA